MKQSHNPQNKKKDSASQKANKQSGRECCQMNQTELSKVRVTATRMTPEQERQFLNALDLFLAEMVRQHREGKGT
jgi:hypothetical protein